MKQAPAVRLLQGVLLLFALASFGVTRLNATITTTTHDVDGDGIVDFALEEESTQVSYPGGGSVHLGGTLIAQPGMVFLGSASERGFLPAYDAGVTVPVSLIPTSADDNTVRRIPLEAFNVSISSGQGGQTFWGAAIQNRFFICFRKTTAKGKRYGWVELLSSASPYAKPQTPHSVGAIGLMPEGSDFILTNPGTISIRRVGTNVEVKWSGGRLERETQINGYIWATQSQDFAGTMNFAILSGSQFFRVR